MSGVELEVTGGKTVQGYIDESPCWRDGTEISSTPMTGMQWRVWSLATAGKFFEGLVVFMTGVALPLIVREFELNDTEKGMLGAATLFGVLIGATALGGLSDLFGRKRMFIVEMIIFIICLVLLVISPSYVWLLIYLFGMGVALGCDYPTAHMVISESIPSSARGRLVLSAFGFQAVGALAGTAIGYLILYKNPSLGAWRWMYATAVIPALLVCLGRFFIPESGHWLVSRGRMEEAERAMHRLLKRNPPYPKEIKLLRSGSMANRVHHHSWIKDSLALFKGKLRRSTILASVPWFLQDLSTYGIGIFTPTILAAVVCSERKTGHCVADIVYNDMLAAEGAAFIDLLLLVGIIAAVLLVDKIGRIRLQIVGFIGCAVGLFVASLSVGTQGSTQLILIFSGFMLFSFMTNLGPNAMTYLIAGEVFPTHVRGKGAGLAASISKIGAVATAFLFPILLKDLGMQLLLYILVGASLAGALITWIFAIETKGVNLEEIGA